MAAAVLVETDPRFCFPTATGISVRLLRVWRVGDHVLIAVVTERAGDAGMSITNAAKTLIVELERRYPGNLVWVVEHYPDNVLLGAGARPQWRYLSAADAHVLLPGVQHLP